MIDADQLSAYVAAIERLDFEIDELNKRKAEMLKEAQSAGFNKRAVRLLIQKRRDSGAALDQQVALDVYEGLLAARRQTD